MAVTTIPVLTARYIRNGWQVVDESDTAVTLKKPIRLKMPALMLVILSFILTFILGPVGLLSFIFAAVGLFYYHRYQQKNQIVRLVAHPDGSIDVR